MVVLLSLLPAGATADAARVQVQAQGLVSATFDATPVREALDALRRATGVEVVVPAAFSEKTVALAIGRSR